jgi:hypothetical protein
MVGSGHTHGTPVHNAVLRISSEPLKWAQAHHFYKKSRNAKEMWDTLQARYEVKGPWLKIMTFRDMMRVSLTECKDMTQYIRSKLVKITNLGVRLEE